MVKVGDHVRFITEDYKEVDALVTCVHGETCINLLWLSLDETKRDPYGRQIERASSVQHESMSPHVRGRVFFTN